MYLRFSWSFKSSICVTDSEYGSSSNRRLSTITSQTSFTSSSSVIWVLTTAVKLILINAFFATGNSSIYQHLLNYALWCWISRYCLFSTISVSNYDFLFGFEMMVFGSLNLPSINTMPLGYSKISCSTLPISWSEATYWVRWCLQETGQ